MGRTSGAAERLRGRIDSEGWSGVKRSEGCRGGKWSERQVFLADENGGNSKQRRRVGPRWLEAAKPTGAEGAGTGTGAA